MKEILIDIGSSSIKVYKYIDNELTLLQTKSFDFKKDFDPELGVQEMEKAKLIDFIKTIQKDYPEYIFNTYATAIWRKFSVDKQEKFKDEFFVETSISFNIITQEMESFYLEKALIANCTITDSVLLINIGGGSTELIIVQNGEVFRKEYIDFGIGKILQEFPGINYEYSEYHLAEIVTKVKEMLPGIDMQTPYAFYTGGELSYMKLANYTIRTNTIFEDKDHPFVICLQDFQLRNEQVFSHIPLFELEQLMPLNPKWMHGARSCSAIAQSICEKYNVEIIIPSDTNLIHGVVKSRNL